VEGWIGEKVGKTRSPIRKEFNAFILLPFVPLLVEKRKQKEGRRQSELQGKVFLLI
jgi:hypothetical protein